MSNLESVTKAIRKISSINRSTEKRIEKFKNNFEENLEKIQKLGDLKIQKLIDSLEPEISGIVKRIYESKEDE